LRLLSWDTGWERPSRPTGICRTWRRNLDDTLTGLGRSGNEAAEFDVAINIQNSILPYDPILTTATQSKSSTLRKAGLFYLVFVMFSYTTGGPFGLEDMVTTSGPGITLLYLLLLPVLWCIPVSLVSAELTTAMPVEGGFYRWSRAAFGDFWGFLAGWRNWCASFMLGALYAVLFTDSLTFYFPQRTGLRPFGVVVAVIALITYINVRGIRLVRTV